jgi:hypothetical protein
MCSIWVIFLSGPRRGYTQDQSRVMEINKATDISSEYDSPSVLTARSWFSLNKYQPAEKFTRTEWGQQIFKRCFIDDALKHLAENAEWDSYLKENITPPSSKSSSPFRDKLQ